MPQLSHHACGGRRFALYRRDPKDRQFKTIEGVSWCEKCGLLVEGKRK
jgi:hypothetical protein